MKPTATQILQRCKDIVEGNYPENGREVYQAGAIFTITYNLFSVSIQEGSGDSSFERAAFLLGMDSEPAPGVELDWQTIEPLRRWEADYNNTLCAVIDRWEYGYVSSVFANGNNTQDIKESAPVSRDWDEACAWCEAQIIKIVTQTPKQ